jgi:type IV secretion system protein TrbL
MNPQFDVTMIDTITRAFLDALQTGQGALAQYSLPLLGVFVVLAFYLEMTPLLLFAGSAVSGDAVGSFVLLVLKSGIFYWLLLRFADLAQAAFDTFLQWGLAPTGGSLSVAQFRMPSTVMVIGFRAGAKLKLFVDAFSGWGAMWNFFTLATYTAAYWIVVVSFAAMALHMMMVLIEFHMAVLVGYVLIPWAILRPTAFFGEFSVGWLTGALVRIFVTGATMGIAVPLFDLIGFRTTGGDDPTFYSAVVCALTALIFAILSWVIPGRAASIAGRGMSLALHGGTVMAGAAGGMRGVLVVAQLARSVPSLLGRA